MSTPLELQALNTWMLVMEEKSYYLDQRKLLKSASLKALVSRFIIRQFVFPQCPHKCQKEALLWSWIG